VSPDTRRLGTIALRLAGLGGALWFLIRGIAWSEIVRIIRGASFPLLGATIAINGVMMVVKAARVRLLFRKRPSLAICFLSNLASSAINNVTPFRGGDLARIWMLERGAGVTKTMAAVATLVERIFELLTLAALGAVASRLVPGQRWAAVASPLMFAGSLAVVGLLRRAPGDAPGPALEIATHPPGSPPRRSERFARLWARLRAGTSVLREPGVMPSAIVLSGLAWLLETGMVMLTSRAVGLGLGPALAIVVIVGINAAMALPAIPAGAGIFEAGATLVLVLAGVGKGQALAFALLYHVVQVVPVTLAGAVAMIQVGSTFGGLAVPEVGPGEIAMSAGAWPRRALSESSVLVRDPPRQRLEIGAIEVGRQRVAEVAVAPQHD
jgi:glycosyltransferase 2 family protein